MQAARLRRSTTVTSFADPWSRFDRPDLVAKPDLPRGDRTESRYFNTDPFKIVRQPRYGTARA